jgi:hypothetical protein
MKSDDVSNAGCAVNVAKDIKEWTIASKGGFAFAREPLKALELLSSAPQGTTVVLTFDGSQPDGGSVYSQIKRMTYTASLLINDALDISPEADFTRSPNEQASLLEMVDKLEDRIATFTPPCLKDGRDSDMDRVKLEGTASLILPDGQPLRGYSIKFSFKIQPPRLTLRQ